MALNFSKIHHNVEEKTTCNKKRVVHVTSIGLSPRLFLVKHFAHLLQENYDIVLVCADDENARFVIQTTGISFVPFPFKQHTSPLIDILNLLRLWRLFRTLKPIIVHSHMSKAGFVAPSNRDDAIKIGICPEDKAVVLGPGTACGVDTNRFDPQKAAPRGVELRRKAGIPQECWLVGYVGRIVPHKGIETILQAWRLLNSEIRSNAYLCIFGTLDHRRMQTLVEQAVSDPDLHVKYMGFCHDMPAWYSVMTLLAQPSWHEGWGYNVLEAACCGVPAVGTKISATVDAIVDGETGLLVPVKNPKTMAEVVTKLLKDEDLRKRLGQAARQRTINFFSQDKICSLLVQEYQHLLNTKTR